MFCRLNSSKYFPYNFLYLSNDINLHRWPAIILDTQAVYGTEIANKISFEHGNQYVAHKDAVNDYMYDADKRITTTYCYLPISVMRADNSWYVKTKYQKAYEVQLGVEKKSFYATMLHVTMTGYDIDYQKVKMIDCYEFEETF